jgi:hypothetical protein
VPTISGEETAPLVFRNHQATPSVAACQQTQSHNDEFGSEVYQITFCFSFLLKQHSSANTNPETSTSLLLILLVYNKTHVPLSGTYL